MALINRDPGRETVLLGLAFAKEDEPVASFTLSAAGPFKDIGQRGLCPRIWYVRGISESHAWFVSSLTVSLKVLLSFHTTVSIGTLVSVSHAH